MPRSELVAAVGRRDTSPASTSARCARPGADEAAAQLLGPLPEEGDGALAAVRELLEEGLEASIASAGPRCFHFVTGGVTPAALGADWLASTLDQNGFAWIESPLSGRLEVAEPRLAQGALRPPGGVGRGAHDGGDDGELHGARRRPPVVGRAA